MDPKIKKNIQKLKKLFPSKLNSEELYLTIIELGKKLPKLAPNLKTNLNKVEGCQSTTYLCSSYKNGVLIFFAESDALISAGLAALLIFVYNKQSPQVIIANPPDFIKELGLHVSLSPHRANGLMQIYLKMKQAATKVLKKTLKS